MSVPKPKFRTAAALALILSATALAGCAYYDEPAYPNYAAAYPGYYPNYGYYGYPGYYPGPTVGLGFRFGGDDWHEHHEWHEHHGWR